MIDTYFYPIFLLLLVCLIIWGLGRCGKYIPYKIRIISISGYVLLFLRYTCLLIFCFDKNILFLYLLKPIYFLHFVCIPVLAFMMLYIFMRNDKFKFLYIFILSICISAFYIFGIYKSSYLIRLSEHYGYIMLLENSAILDFIYVSIILILLIISILFFENKGTDKRGLLFVILSSFVSVFGIIIEMLSFNELRVSILGEFAFLLTLNYSIKKIKDKL